MSHGSCSYEVSRGPEYDRIDGDSDGRDGHADDTGLGSAVDSSRITESLRQILEQARRIRSQEPSMSTPRTGAKTPPATLVARNRNEDRSPGTVDISRSKHTQGISTVKEDGGGSSANKKAGHGYGGVTRPTAATLSRRRSKEALPALSQHASDGRPTSAASLMPRHIGSSPGLRRANSSSTRSRADPTFNPTTSPAAGQTSVLSAASGAPADGKPKTKEGRTPISRRKSTGSATSTRPYSACSQRKHADESPDTAVPQSLDSDGRATAACNARAPALDLPQGMREELVRYALARDRLVGIGSKDTNGEATRGVAGVTAGRGVSRTEQEQESDDEARLLAALKFEPAAESLDDLQQQHGHRPHGLLVNDDGGLRVQDRPVDGRRNELVGGRTALGRQAQMPDPQFAAWDELLRQNPQPPGTAGENRVPGREGETRAHPVNDEASIEKKGKGSVQAGMEERVKWGEVEGLQQSLLIMLDEVEGRRVLSAAEDSMHGGRGRGRSTHWTSDEDGDEDSAAVEGDEDPAAVEGDEAAFRKFEDWYAWNKVRYERRGLVRSTVNCRQNTC